MLSLYFLLYALAGAFAVRWLMARAWPASRRKGAILALVAGLPLAVVAWLLASQTGEAAGWGVGLVVVTLVPANVLALVAGWLWHRARQVQP